MLCSSLEEKCMCSLILALQAFRQIMQVFVHNFSKENQALYAQYHPNIPFSESVLWQHTYTLQKHRTQEH